MPEGGEAAQIEAVEWLARLIADCMYGIGSFDQFNAEERTIALAESREKLAALDRVRSSGSAAQNHEHEWVDARNSVVESGEVCLGCGAVRRSPQGQDHEGDLESVVREEAERLGYRPGEFIDDHMAIVRAALDAVRRSLQGEDHEAERWTMVRRRDWPNDQGALVPRGAPVPEPDQQLEVFEVARVPSPVSGTEPDTGKLVEALRAIAGPEDQGPWIAVYRAAGGGYEGLQAIAREALFGFSGPQEPQEKENAMNDASKEKPEKN